MRTVLTIAGSDCSGGAGVQADLKTIGAHRLYGMSVLTALTAQNTTGVHGVFEVDPDFVGRQIDCVMNDIFPDAVKIGMVSTAEIIEIIALKLKYHEVSNLVVDPVMLSTSGRRLLNDNAVEALVTRLFPLADIITPNIPEAMCLSGFDIQNGDDMIRAAEKIAEKFGGFILIKGGHRQDTADDLLYGHGEIRWFAGERIKNENTHGTGCTLSSAIACSLAAGHSMPESVGRAKDYITLALKAQLNLGRGCGPLNHCVL